IPQENHTIISTGCQEALIRAKGKTFNGERSATASFVSLHNRIEGRIQCAEQVSRGRVSKDDGTFIVSCRNHLTIRAVNDTEHPRRIRERLLDCALCCHIPQENSSTSITRCEHLATGTVGKARDTVFMTEEGCAQGLICGHIPQLHCFIHIPRCKRLPIRAE